MLIFDFDAYPINSEVRAVEMDYSQNSIWRRFSKSSTDITRDFFPRFKSKPIIVEDKVWIGARAIILKGVRIGYGLVVGAGAVVSQDAPPCSIVIGNPAKVVKTLKGEDAQRL